MMRILLTGLGAGVAAALLFASVTSGVGLSVLLFYLAPLPIMIVALGWSHWAGLTAALAAAAMLGGATSIVMIVTFLASVGAPAWWLGYLALLGRPVANGASPQMEWYPPGRLVLWAAVIGAGLTAGALMTLGSDESTIRSSLRSAVGAMLRVEAAETAQPVADAFKQGNPAGKSSDTGVRGRPHAASPTSARAAAADASPMIEVLARILPPAAAIIAALSQTANLWLAGLVVRLSGRLRRPWPDLTALSFPPLAAVLYGALLGAALLPGLPGLITSLFAATLTMAFAMVGCAVMHTATRGMQGRAAVLWGAYGCAFFLLWPILLMTVVGVADTLFGLRGRFSRSGPPSAPGAQNG